MGPQAPVKSDIRQVNTERKAQHQATTATAGPLAKPGDRTVRTVLYIRFMDINDIINNISSKVYFIKKGIGIVHAYAGILFLYKLTFYWCKDNIQLSAFDGF